MAFEAIARRCEMDADFVERQIRTRRVGFAGELKLDHYLQTAVLPENSAILCSYQPVGYEMDTVIICETFICVLEVKNMKGILSFEQDKSQFIRKIDDQLDSFHNPIDQVERNAYYFQKVLRELNMHLPIYSAVVITQQSAIIRDVPAGKYVFHLSGLQKFLSKLMNSEQVGISAQQFAYLKEQLLLRHQPFETWRPYQLPSIRKGVLCEKNHLMVYHKNKFYCPVCKEFSAQAFWLAMQDYKVLVMNTISNKEFREFVGIDDVITASKLLAKLNWSHNGGTKKRIYNISIPLEKHYLINSKPRQNNITFY